jgi:subtilase family serine protease
MVARDKLGRPTPGRHVYTLRLDVDNEVAETNEANNQRRIVIDIPENHVMSATPQEKPDVRLQDPHVHQFWNAVTFHFFIYNFHASTTLPAVKWRVIRVQDGVVIKEGVVSNVVARSTAANAPPASFRYTEEFKGPDVEYLLILDPDNEIDEAYENNNQVKFIIDWTQAGAG